MLFENMPLPLPWYPSVTLQDRFRQNVAQDAVIIQLAPSDGLLPFQFRKPSASALPVTWKIKCCSQGVALQEYIDGYEDSTACNISAFISLLEKFTLVDPIDPVILMDYFMFRNEYNATPTITVTLPDGLPEGVYYMEMDFGSSSGGKWCSETFRVPPDRFSWDVPSEDCNDPCLKWSHDSDIAPMHYDPSIIILTPFYNLLYLDTFITASEPVFEVKGEQDGMDEFHSTFEKIIIKYRISCIIPDYIKIALYAMLIHENKYLFTEKALREGKIKNLEVSSTLSSDGAHSQVELLFEQISLFVKTGCANDMIGPDLVEMVETPTLETDYCEASGGVTVLITTSLPPSVYGELWGGISGVYSAAIGYISRDALLAGYSGMVLPSSGYDAFKIRFKNFTYYVGESTISIPTPSC